MNTTEEMFKLSIKETCAELRHVQSKLNAIVVRSIEDTFTGDTETDNLRHDMLLALRHYQDTLFATINLLRRKNDPYSMSLRAKFSRMEKNRVEANESSKENGPLGLVGQCLGDELPKQCNEFDNKEQGQDVKLPEFEPLTERKTEMEKTTKPEYVICRGYYCGVHAGYIKERNGNHVVLNEARRLWKWNAVKGISLSEVAKYGITADGSKVCTKLDEIWLGDVYEIIPCTDEARKTIEEATDADVN